MTQDIQPADVYRLVWWLVAAVTGLAGLVVAKLFMTVRVARRVHQLCDKAEPLLTMATIHGQLSDAQKERVATVVMLLRDEIKAETDSVKQAVRVAVHDVRDTVNVVALKAEAAARKGQGK